VSKHFDAVVFDDRVAQNVAGDGVEVFAGLHGDFEVFALADVFDAAMAEAVERGPNGLTLGIENGRLEGYVYAGFHCIQFRKSKLAEEVCLQVGRFFQPAPGALRRGKAAHQSQHLYVVRMNIAKRRALFAAAADGGAPIHIRVEPRMTRTLSPPADGADLEHSYYYLSPGFIDVQRP
jgi:hypothetical protein